MAQSIIRSDRWDLTPTKKQIQYALDTEKLYRQFARALISVVYTHWTSIADASSPCAAVEKLVHRTSKNPNPRYQYFAGKFYKFPSYLRRAVIQAAIGQVSSFVTRYRQWQSGSRKRKDALPPRLNAVTSLRTVLYQGQCILFLEDAVKIKLYKGKDWSWETISVKNTGKRHLLPESKTMSPSMLVSSRGISLSVPFKIKPPTKQEVKRICSVDLEINTIAVASIVNPDGTVTARKFFNSCAADIDRRDKRLQAIRKKARLTMGGRGQSEFSSDFRHPCKTGKLSKGFCRSIYRKAHKINRQIAHKVSKELINFATANGAAVIVFEHMTGWKPRGGKRGSTLRQRFHGWLKSSIVSLTTEKYLESGGKTVLVNPRGTSSWAFDGSGQVTRNKKNYALATFPTGKKYNADLSASYNIGARYWLKLVRRKRNESGMGKSTQPNQRMPGLLCHLWSEIEAAYLPEGS
jgi:IS605 OrfB family transposase